MPVRILAISGSLRASSSNTRILNAVKDNAPAHVQITMYQGIDMLPHFNPDLEAMAPEAVHTFRQALRDHDAVLICTPEYAHGVPGVLKNALDWVVGSGELVDKPVALISASPSMDGGNKALASLAGTIRVMNASLPDAATLSIPFISRKLTPDGPDTETHVQLQTLLDALLQAIPNA